MEINAKLRLTLSAAGKVPGVRPGYLNSKTVEEKLFEFVDDGSRFGGAAYLGQIGKTDKYALVFASYDFGTQPRIASFPNEAAARKVFAKFKDGISYDAILQLL